MQKNALKKKKGFLKKLWQNLGPGLVTGASDDDPSGITTYSQAGAKFGLATLWTALITFPLMAAVQEMCARIGIVTSKGLTETLKKYYPRWLLWIMIALSFPAVILNIGADIAGMGAVTHMLVPAMPVIFYSILYTVIMCVCIIYFSYTRIAQIMKYICIVLLVYLVVPFITKTDWSAVLRSTFVPQIIPGKEFISMLVAILGTTISPYLFFWQTTMEAEGRQHNKKKLVVDKLMLDNARKDVNLGMFFSNLVMLFIIITAGTVLFSHGTKNIDTVEQAASALKPIAGKYAYLLFAVGVVGTGFLSIPVLCGSVSYMISETFNWKQGLDKKFYQAPAFYGVIILSLIAGIVINLAGFSPVKALIYTAILYGITAPPLILMILLIANNKKIMGDQTNGRRSNILGWAAFVLMTTAVFFLFI